MPGRCPPGGGRSIKEVRPVTANIPGSVSFGCMMSDHDPDNLAPPLNLIFRNKLKHGSEVIFV
jgi:hypothetical protein